MRMRTVMISVLLVFPAAVALGAGAAPASPPAAVQGPTNLVFLAPYGGYAFVNYSKKTEMRNPKTGEIRIAPGDLSNPLVNLIQNAKQSIDIASYIFSKNAPAYIALLAASHHGVKIRLFLDSLFLDKSIISSFERYNSTIAVKTLDPEKAEAAIGIPFVRMHEKFGIIDGKDVFNGSSNVSLEANIKYTESRFFFLNNPEMVKVFQEEFDRLWAMGKWLYNPEEKRKDDKRKKKSD